MKRSTKRRNRKYVDMLEQYSRMSRQFNIVSLKLNTRGSSIYISKRSFDFDQIALTPLTRTVDWFSLIFFFCFFVVVVVVLFFYRGVMSLRTKRCIALSIISFFKISAFFLWCGCYDKACFSFPPSVNKVYILVQKWELFSFLRQYAMSSYMIFLNDVEKIIQEYIR